LIDPVATFCTHCFWLGEEALTSAKGHNDEAYRAARKLAAASKAEIRRYFKHSKIFS
jgi:hypothetical protein